MRLSRGGTAILEVDSGDGSLKAQISPDCGGSIASLRTPDGMDLLWRNPEEARNAAANMPRSMESIATRSQADWVSNSVGGWEVMSPNAGAYGTLNGLVYPFHGTAGRASWTVDYVDSDVVEMHAALPDFDLEARRRVAISGMSCMVTEGLSNRGNDSRIIAWGSHLAFGRDFVDGDLNLEVDGDILGGTVDGASADPASLADLIRSPRSGQSILAYIRSRTPRGRAVLTNTSRQIAATTTWNADVYRYLWVWIELNGTTGWPFFGSGRAVGVEPVSSWPAVGVARLPAESGTQVTLDPGESLQCEVAVTVNASGQGKRENEHF